MAPNDRALSIIFTFQVADGEAKQRHENSITSPADIFAQYLATKKKTTYQDSQSAQINSIEEQSLTANVPEHKMPKVNNINDCQTGPAYRWTV